MKNIWITLAIIFTFAISVPALSADTYAATTKTVTETAQTISKVSINSADANMLGTVPGIGPKTAEAIIAYRDTNGKFASVDDLVKVKGIGEKKLAKMMPYLQK